MCSIKLKTQQCNDITLVVNQFQPRIQLEINQPWACPYPGPWSLRIWGIQTFLRILKAKNCLQKIQSSHPTGWPSTQDHIDSITMTHPFCVCVCVGVCSVVSDSVQPHKLQLTSLLCPQSFPGKTTRTGCHFLLQGIFLTQESNLCLMCLLHWQVGSLALAPPAKLYTATYSWS